MSSSNFLLGKLALVTGGSGTIGQAIAKSLVSQGASVVLTARRMEKLQKAQEALQEVAAETAQVHVITSDVSNEDSVVELFQQIDQLEDGKGIDLLVNNAGKLPPWERKKNPSTIFYPCSKKIALNPELHHQVPWRRDRLSI